MLRLLALASLIIGCGSDQKISKSGLVNLVPKNDECTALISSTYDEKELLLNIYEALTNSITSIRMANGSTKFSPNLLSCPNVNFADASIKLNYNEIRVNTQFISEAYSSNSIGIYGLLLHEMSHVLLEHKSQSISKRRIQERQADFMSGILFRLLDISKVSDSSYVYLEPFRDLPSEYHDIYSNRVEYVKLGFQLGARVSDSILNDKNGYNNELLRLSRKGVPGLYRFDHSELVSENLSFKELEELRVNYPEQYEQLEQRLKDENIDIEDLDKSDLKKLNEIRADSN